MSKTRIAVVALLFVAPFLFLMGVGGYYLAVTHGPGGFRWMFWAWWPMFLSMVLAYVLAWRWTRKSSLPPTDGPVPNYWTDRDNSAWEKVTAKAKTFERITAEQMADAKHYSDLGLDLAKQVAEVYNPG